ncbi:hypothetical protein LCGC14_1579290 [marine sediment metagenome]|uniref:Uncharacterized protein n=1 Tax=marine sediment metagenome TaxID=412755 RepID=A0A0F9KY92_9ZZZZ
MFYTGTQGDCSSRANPSSSCKVSFLISKVEINNIIYRVVSLSHLFLPFSLVDEVTS